MCATLDIDGDVLRAAKELLARAVVHGGRFASIDTSIPRIAIAGAEKRHPVTI